MNYHNGIHVAFCCLEENNLSLLEENDSTILSVIIIFYSWFVYFVGDV